jgi:hypothetical protein
MDIGTWSSKLGALVLAVGLAAGGCGHDDHGRTRAEPSTTVPVPTTPSTTGTTTPPTVPSSTTTSTTPPPPPAAPVATGLRRGDSGPEVSEIQARLSELGCWSGEADGTFGWDTHHAVVALQKAAGLERDGIVGPETQRALDDGVRPEARSRTGRVVEIDLGRQLLLVVEDGSVVAVFDTSTGARSGTTPPGQWTISREIDGLRRSPLGLLYRPKYVHEGVAIHGYTSVPAHPATHGCVRVTYPAMDHIWAAGLMPVGTPVWVY